MSSSSYLDKTFVVDDRDARIRNSLDLMQFERYRVGDLLPSGKKAGDLKIIPFGTRVRVTDVRIVNGIVFAYAQSEDNPPVALGWTSSRNFAGKFVNETLGEVKPRGTDRKGANAAWENGVFIGQKTLVNIVDAYLEVEQITLENLPRYLELVDAAAEDGVSIRLRDGFRTFADQEYLYEGYRMRKPGFNQAAQPGFSNHQHGQALDLVVNGGPGDPVYNWLAANGPRLGFIRTVNKEPWHWEYRPAEATRLAARGQHTLARVKV